MIKNLLKKFLITIILIMASGLKEFAHGGDIISLTQDITNSLTQTIPADWLQIKSVAADATPTGTFTGQIRGDGGLIIGDGIKPVRVILENPSNNYSGSTTINSSATLISNSNALVIPSSDINLQGGEIQFTGLTDTLDYLSHINASGTGTSTISNDSWTVNFWGAVNISGNLVMSSTASLQQLGDYTVMGEGSVGSFRGGAWINAQTTLGSGATLDFSNQTIGRSNVIGFKAPTTGGILNIAIDDAGNSTNLDLYNQINDVQGLKIVLCPISGTYAPEAHVYRLFFNCNGLDINTAIQSITGAPAGLKAIPMMGEEGSIVFKFIRSSSPESIKTADTYSTASTNSSLLVTTVLSRTIQSTQEDDHISNDSFSSAFRSNPFRAPDLTKEFANITNGAVAQEAQDNFRKWSRLRGEKTGIWAQPFAMQLRQVKNQGTPGFHTRTGGVMFGFDHKLRYDVVVGGALGYSRTALTCDENAGKNRINDRFASLFGTWFRDQWSTEIALTAGMENYRGTRNTGLNNFVSNNHGGYQISPHIAGRYTFDLKDFKIDLFAAFNYVYSYQQGYQETGINGDYIKGTDSSMLRSQAGAKLSKDYKFEDMEWIPAAALSLINKNPLKKGIIATSSGTSFESTTVATTDIALTLESSVKFDDGYSCSALYTGEIGTQYTSNQISLKFAKKL